MTPKEMAKEMVDKFSTIGLQQRNEGIQCALIAVKYIIMANPHSNPFNTTGYSSMTYWYEVQEEIEKL